MREKTRVTDVAAVVISLAALAGSGLTYFLTKDARDISYFDNAQTCAVYREQVIALVDRGMTTAQIDGLLNLEEEFDGVEAGCGSIEQVADSVDETSPTPGPAAR